MNTNTESRPPFPPFTHETATQKVRMAEDGWNNREPKKSPGLTHRTANGATVPSFQKGESKSSNS